MATYCTVLRYIEGDTCTKMRGRENVAFVNRGKKKSLFVFCELFTLKEEVHVTRKKKMELLSQKWQLSNSPLFHLHLLLMSSYGPFSHPTSVSNWWSGGGNAGKCTSKKHQRGFKVSLHDYWKVGEPESTAGFHSSFLFFAECTPSFPIDEDKNLSSGRHF